MPIKGTSLTCQPLAAIGYEGVMMFDSYVIVDWSANSHPIQGANSVWYALAEGVTSNILTENPRTRIKAYNQLLEILTQLTQERQRVLLGFDFPFGYPYWFGDLLRGHHPPWHAVWQLLAERIVDNEANHNNRFQVAAQLNRETTRGLYPFWGCPANRANANLATRNNVPVGCEEFRMTERAIRGPQSAFKLFGHGCVGSQALTGIPYLERLKRAEHLKRHLTIWPFETGLRVPNIHSGNASVVMVEIYPSILTIPRRTDAVRDKLQVRELASYFQQRDQEGTLQRLFAPSQTLHTLCESRIVSNEGWILGVEFTESPNGG